MRSVAAESTKTPHLLSRASRHSETGLTLMYDFLERLPLHSVAELQLLGHMALPRTPQPALRHGHLTRHMNQLQKISRHHILLETKRYDSL